MVCELLSCRGMTDRGSGVSSHGEIIDVLEISLLQTAGSQIVLRQPLQVVTDMVQDDWRTLALERLSRGT